MEEGWWWCVINGADFVFCTIELFAKNCPAIAMQTPRGRGGIAPTHS
jgi:hypothetical protein